MNQLSPSEQNVATYLRMGLSNKEIGERLFICEKTVKFHIANIFRKRGVKTRAEFIAKENGTSDENLREAVMATSESRPLAQGARQVQVVSKTQEDKIMFINEHFKVSDTLDHLHHMMKEVTKEKLDHNTVNAACNCVSRLNDTINTAIQAAKFLNER